MRGIIHLKGGVNEMKKIKSVIQFIFRLYYSLFMKYPCTVAYLTFGVIMSIKYRNMVVFNYVIVTGLFGRFVGWLMNQEVTIFHIKK